ncbi:hypothetical protein T440DRAFT_121570 [Plenodomus tracheiphilus IPT5]|uniref:HORMA domain-containing protein n=1 Tax=Plenodomus tracheiphilus IPT5 TaxID=1408161 RepID=A0A6A7B5M9_9PLEO|nr:hypothetical protein T440DRAFT_121570 [Plenodomus tracheiphilus IPT5]
MTGRMMPQHGKAAAVSSRTRRSKSSKKYDALPSKNATQLQLQKPTPVLSAPTVQTATAQQVDQQQSQELMQVMIHASLSSVLYFRSCFPEDCFETRACLNNSSQYRYDDYASGNQGAIQNKVGGYIRALSKGVSGRADRFLELLETGIFDAFRRGYLSSVHLTMFEKAEFPENVLESWTLTFHYVDVSGGRSVSSMDLSEQSGSKITLSHVKLSLNDLIRKLGHSCADLPALPEERHMRVEIGYTDDRPESYFAPGFQEPVRDVFRFPSDEDWEQSTLNAGMVYTRHHAVALKGSHLSRTNADVDNALPSCMQYTEEVSKLKDIVPDLGERAKRIEMSRLKSLAPKATEQRDTTSTSKNAEVEELRSMLQPSDDVSNTQPTQPAVQQQLTQKLAIGEGQVVFSSAVIDRADRARDATLPPRGKETIRTEHEHVENMTVKCACGHAEVEGDTILCQFCDKWQHLHCMGYSGKSDRRIPSTYLCYECLLAEENQCMQQQRERAVYRRALWLLQQTSFEHAQAFGRAINYTEHEAKIVMHALRQHGILKKTSQRSKWQVVLDMSAEAQERMKNIYCDPTIGIKRFLDATSAADGDWPVSAGGHSKKRARADVIDEVLPTTKHRIYGAGTIGIDATHTPKRACRST